MDNIDWNENTYNTMYLRKNYSFTVIPSSVIVNEITDFNGKLRFQVEQNLSISGDFSIHISCQKLSLLSFSRIQNNPF